MKISAFIDELIEIQNKLGDIEIKAMVQSDSFGGDFYNFSKSIYFI